MLNALSIDVEDYFQVEAFSSQIRYEDWDSYPSRVERNVDRILDILAGRGTKATFFVLGWVADKFPHLAKRIADEATKSVVTDLLIRESNDRRRNSSVWISGARDND